jgi:hypothetical protein
MHMQSQLPLRIVKTPSAADRWHPSLSEPTSQSVDPSQDKTEQENTEQDNTWKIHPLLGLAAVGLYFCWPIVFHTCLSISDFNALEYVLLGAGSLLWLISCAAVSRLILAAVAVRSARLRVAIMVGWLLGFPLLLIFCPPLPYSIAPDWLAPYMRWLTFYLLIPTAFLWFGLCYYIYDTLFTMMETRWPATKMIRPIIRGLLRILQQQHQGS